MRNMMLVVGGLGLALAAACVSADAPEGDVAAPQADDASDASEQHVVLRVEIERGHSVTFYEPAPGALYQVERMAPNQKFVLGGAAASDALAAFAQLRPGQAVPAALQAAYDRAIAMPSESVSTESARGAGQPDAGQSAPATPGVSQQSLVSSSSAATFVNTNNGCDWGSRWSTCSVNWGGGYFATASSATAAICIVDHYAGNGLIVQMTVNGNVTNSFHGAGTIAQYSLGAAGPDVTRRIDLTNASGDAFHVGCRWTN